MKLAIVNGSPRGRNSNSDKIIKWVLADIKDSVGFTFEELYAVDLKERNKQMTSLKSADSILVIFPLYTDGMPGITKEFFEQMENIKADLMGKSISFVVHSGFPEAKQSRAVEKYTEYFSKLLKMNYLGTVIMGGSEALTAAPENMFKKKIKFFNMIGNSIKEDRCFNEEEKYSISSPEVLPKHKLVIMRNVNISDFFWNRYLKKNNAYDKRLDRPYL